MKTLKEITATILMLIAAFAYPIFFNWYQSNFLISEMDSFLPVMISVYMLMGIFVVVVHLWIKAIRNN